MPKYSRDCFLPQRAMTLRLKGVAIEHEEPNEGRLSRTVLWEGGGEIPLPDLITGNAMTKKLIAYIKLFSHN